MTNIETPDRGGAGHPASPVPKPVRRKVVYRRPGETLAMVLKALRENPAGLTTPELSRILDIDQTVLGVQLGNFRGAGHIESSGTRRRYTWYIDGLEHQANPVALAPRSLFDPRPAVAPIVSPGSSRVMVHVDKGDHHIDRRDAHFVEPDDFTPGAFMADWLRRIKTSEGA